MTVLDRFLKYVKIDTQSSPANEASLPSSEKEFNLGKLLESELKELGAHDVVCDENCYVYGFIPASKGYEATPKVGFIAHMDTSPDFSGKDVVPIVTENYDGNDVTLNGKTLTVRDFPHLKKLHGRTLITADGTTLLGADDKAGIAEIMTLISDITESCEPHGRIAVCFTPDEEIGNGTCGFDLKRFGCDFAYTVDGGEEGEIVYENFNAAQAVFKINGVNVHPGSAKNIMVNAALVASEINSMLPSADIPRLTEGYEGFYHLCRIEGDAEHAESTYIVRDHDQGLFESRLTLLRHIAKTLNEKYGENTVELSVTEQYRNMKEKITPCFHIVEAAFSAIRKAGIEPVVEPIRGGTDGARLSFMGLPCPNLGTGGYAFHGPFEHITKEGMEKSVEILKNIVRITASN